MEQLLLMLRMLLADRFSARPRASTLHGRTTDVIKPSPRQQFFEVDPTLGIVRMEFLGGELLYSMRVISHGAFNLCPFEMRNPEGG
jgi:hypothetical protein